MLTSTQNPLVKQVKKLHQAKGRLQQATFLLEGTHLVQEAQATGTPLQMVCHTEAWRDRYPELAESLGSLCPRIELVTPEVLRAMATTVQPDGIIALADRVHQDFFEMGSLGLVLENIQDPGNLGTLIRTAAAVGADGLWVNNTCVDLDHPKVLRASAGQWFRLPMVAIPDLRGVMEKAQSAGIQIVTTLPTAAQSYWEADLCRPSLIVLGNEGAGLSPEIAALADCPVRIPLAQGVESLNVAIAASLVLYEARRQRTKG